MKDFLATLSERKGDLAQASLEHVTISLAALLIAMIIAIPLAIYSANKHRKLGEFILQTTGVMQTIPSLALLGLLIPFVGIGTTPALIALVLYALLPIFQNTYVGLSEIDPAIKEASEAFGMSRFRSLRKVEIPLALPIIISGIRSSLVLIIGTATLSALVGGGGLGSLIVLGIDRNNPSLTLIGAIASALLAITFSGIIVGLQKIRPRNTMIILGVVCACILGVFAYQTVEKQTERVVIAGKLGSEPDILINMYKELIEEDNSHTKVELKENFGKTSFLFSALKSKQIDVYPEFTGTVLDSLVKVPDSLKSKKLSPKQTYDEASELLKKQDNMTFLEPMKYQNTYALAVKEDFAKKNNLKNISDLKPIESDIKAGFTHEFIDRNDGYKGIQKKYSLNFGSVKGMEPSLRYTAINNGDINLIDAYSTDSELERYKLTILKDDKGLFPSYQGAPLMTEEFAKKHPKVVKSLNKLAGKISEKEMINMNYQVNVENKSPKDVAHDYLTSHNLIKEDK